MGDHHNKKNMNESEQMGNPNFMSVSRVPIDSHVDDWPRHDHHFHNQHRHHHHGHGRKRGDRENQRKRLAQHQSIETKSSNHQDEATQSTQEINASDYELETFGFNSDIVDEKCKLIQEYSRILKTMHEQNKYLDQMRRRILSSCAESERQSLETLLFYEQTKLNEDLEKALIRRSNYACDHWPESSGISEEASGYQVPESVDSVRQSGGQDAKPGANRAGSGSDLSLDGFSTDANEDSNFQKRGACCCSGKAAHCRFTTGGPSGHSSLCRCQPNPVLIQSPNICCCRQRIGCTKFSY